MMNKRFSERDFNIKARILKYTRNWYWFLFSIVVCGLLAGLYLYVVPPQYEVSTGLLFKQGGSGGNDAFSNLSGLGNDPYMDDEMEVLSSKTLLMTVFSEMPELQTSIYKVEGLRRREVYGAETPLQVKVSRMDPLPGTEQPEALEVYVRDARSFTLSDVPDAPVYAFGDKIRQGGVSFTVAAQPGIAAGTKYRLEFHQPDLYAMRYRDKINIEKAGKNTGILRISLRDESPQKGSAILNKLLEVYRRNTLAAKNESAGNILDFVDSRLAELVADLDEVSREAASFKQESKTVATRFNTQQFLTMASGFYQELEQAKMRRKILESLQSYINAKGAVYTLVPGSVGLKDPALNSLIATFNELQLKRKQVLGHVAPSSLLVKDLDKDIRLLKRSIRENLKTIEQSMVATESELNRNYTLFQNHIHKLPEADRRMLEILRQQGIKQALYAYLLKTAEQARLSQATQVASFRVMDETAADKAPVSPQAPLIYVGAFILGLLLPMGVLYIRDLLDTKIQKQTDITDITEVPIIGELAHDKTGKRLVVQDKSRTPISEMFRLIRSNLQFAALGKQVQVILTTSSMSGEGKTFFCTNMGASIALTGKRVVVLEFDIRRPKLLKGLGMSARHGITNYVVKPALTVDDLILPVGDVEDLFVIGAGPVPPNPAELMFHPRIDQLFRELRERFDYILLDTSPVGQVADVFNLDRISDACLYLMRYNYTFKQQLPIVNDIYHNRKLRNLMIVLNDATPKHATGSGYGYGSGFGYGGVVPGPGRRLLQRLAGSYSDAV